MKTIALDVHSGRSQMAGAMRVARAIRAATKGSLEFVQRFTEEHATSRRRGRK